MTAPRRPSNVARISFELPYLALVIAIAFALRIAALNRLPLSLSLDEAVNGLDALRLFDAAWLTPFLQNNFGRETLFIYLQSLALTLYGISPFSLRFVAVLAGTLAVALMLSLGRRLRLENLLALKPLPPNIAPLLAATGLAISYWHIYFSRTGLRAILLPPLLLGSLWCFWRGWYSPSPRPGTRARGWLIVAGFLLGLTFYTYLAARLLPLLFAAFITTELMARPASVKGRATDLVIFGLAGALTAIPIALYFYQYPYAFSSRTQAISIFSTDSLLNTLMGNLIAILRIHLLGGTWLGQWPALSLLTALGFLIGLLVCFRRIKQANSRLLLIWWGLGVAPTLLSQQNWEATTTILRSIVAWPALCLISGIGLTRLADLTFKCIAGLGRLAPQARGRLYPRWLMVVPLLLLIVDGPVTAHNYFAVWAATYNLKDFDDGHAYLAGYLNEQSNRLSLVPLRFYTEPEIRFLLQARYPNLHDLGATSLHTLLASDSQASPEPLPNIYLLPDQAIADSSFVLLVPAAAGSGAAYLLPPLTLPQIKALSDYTRATAPLSTILDGRHRPVAQVYPLDAYAPFLPDEPVQMRPIQANFNNDIYLVGYHVEPAFAKPGETVTLYLKWQVQRLVEGDYDLFLHLFDVPQGQRRGQINIALNRIAYLPFRQPDRPTFMDVYTFRLPPDSPEGVYLFEAGLYHNFSLERLPVTIADAHQPPDDHVILGKFHVQLAPPAPPSFPISAQFGNSIMLVGVDFSTQVLQPGQTLTYRLHWQALGPIPDNYTIFNHLVDAQGKLRAQQDSMPQDNRYPTSMWDPGEIVIDPHTLTLPPDLEPGQYTLRIGLYQVETGQRLLVKNQSQEFVELPGFTTSPETEN